MYGAWHGGVRREAEAGGGGGCGGNGVTVHILLVRRMNCLFITARG